MSKVFQDDYAARCSEKTLQSNDEGFFLTFADNLAEIAGKLWIEKHFGKLTNDRDRLKILYEHEPVKKALVEVLSNVQELYRKKSSEIASSCRKQAQQARLEDNPMKSLSLYSQSVLRSEKTGENPRIDNGNSLSLALFERSKLLMEMGECDHALTDIQLALKENLPGIFKGEAYFRLAVGYRAVEEEKKADVAFRLAEKLLNENKEHLLERYRNELNSLVHFRTEKWQKELPKISGKSSEVFPNACDKLDVKNTRSMGRYMVTKKKIKTGDTLVVEAPEAACLIPETFGSHCHNCFERLTAPIGCPTCSNVAFCRPTCRDQALESYHRYECKIQELLLGSGISVLSHLAFRMVTQKELEQNLQAYKNKKKEHVFSLCTNSDKRSSKDFFRRTVMAAFLLKCLQKVGYFGFSDDSAMPTQAELTIGEILLFNLQMLQFNAHEIYEKVHPTHHRFKHSKIKYIGVGLYPTVALFNHQCYPSVTRYFVGKSIIINAIKPLEEGDLVAENYGPIFTKKPLLERQKYLMSRYWFKCDCTACLQNWPILNNDSVDISARLRCPTKECKHTFTMPLPSGKLSCIECKNTVDLKENIQKLNWCEDQYHLALEKMDQMKSMEGIEILRKSLDIFHKISMPPHKATHIAEETLRACYADLGNKYEVLVKKT